MESKEKQITNEAIRKKFISQFELVNYAIQLAENMIRTGREPRMKIDTQNRAMQILAEIACGKDRFDELIPAPSVEIEEDVRQMKEPTPRSGRASDQKKGRKAFSENLR